MASKTNGTNRNADFGRREFLMAGGASVASLALAGVPSLAKAKTFGTMLPHDAIIRMSLVDGLNALKQGNVSSLDYCMAALAQAEKFESHNIFTQVSAEYVKNTATAVDLRRKNGAAIAALQGVPYALKDSVDMVEYYTICGHPSLKNFRPSVDADLVRIYKEADAVCIGKTQIPALSLWWTTENPMTGDTGNPFNQAYKTGGSSGGSGAAVAARIVPFAVAEDTGGSVRVPAAMNGVQGLRPTTGRWPTAGAVPIGFSDTLGPIARTVADIKLLDSLCAVDHPANIAGEVDLKSVRIGYQNEGFLEDLHPWVQQNIEQTINALSNAGATLVEVSGLPATQSFDVAIPILLGEMPGTMAHYFNRHEVYDRSVFGLMNEMHMEALKQAWLPVVNDAPTGESYFVLVNQLMELRESSRKVMDDKQIDLIMYPTSKVPNTPNDGDAVVEAEGPLGETLSELSIGANMLYAPAMKTPAIAMFSGMDNAGLPLSLTFDGHSGQDRRLLDIAEALERVLPPLAEPNSV